MFVIHDSPLHDWPLRTITNDMAYFNTVFWSPTPFIDSTLDKVRQVRQRIITSGRDIRLEVDGGVKASNIRAIAEAGADMFVAGSAIFASHQVLYRLHH